MADIEIQKMADEQTFLMVKPEGVQRGLVGEIISRFEKKGFKLVAMKFVHAPSSHLEEHYKEHKGKPFFERVVKDMSSGPVVPMVFQGKGIIKAARAMLGETDPLKSNPGTIRGDFGISVGRNICHGSDSLESSRREIQLWFKEGEVFQWKPVFHDFLYED